MDSALAIIDVCCTKLYTSTNQADRTEATATLCRLFEGDAGTPPDAPGGPPPPPPGTPPDLTRACVGVKAIPRHQYLLTRSGNPHSHLFAATSLVATVNHHWPVLTPDGRLELVKIVWDMLGEKGLDSGPRRVFAPFVVDALVQCLTRVTTLAWRDDPRVHMTVDRAQDLMQKTPAGRLLGLKVLKDIVLDIQRNHPQSTDRPGLRMLTFRDAALKGLFGRVISMLSSVTNDVPIDGIHPTTRRWLRVCARTTSTTTVVTVVERTLDLLLECLSFDFIGSGSTDMNDTAPVQAPSSWLLLRDDGPIHLLKEFYTASMDILTRTWTATPPAEFDSTWAGEPVKTVLPPGPDTLASIRSCMLQCLRCLEQLAAIRRTIFPEPVRRSRVSLFMNCGVELMTSSTSVADPDAFHHVCRILARFRQAYQLPEIASRPEFMLWMDCLVAFTTAGFEAWQRVSHRSVYYLLKLWAELVGPSTHLPPEEAAPIRGAVSGILRSFVESRLQMCIAGNEAFGEEDDALADDTTTEVYSSAVAALSKYNLRDACNYMTALASSLLDQLKGSPSATVIASVQRQLAWIVYISGAVLENADVNTRMADARARRRSFHGLGLGLQRLRGRRAAAAEILDRATGSPVDEMLLLAADSVGLAGDDTRGPPSRPASSAMYRLTGAGKASEFEAIPFGALKGHLGRAGGGLDGGSGGGGIGGIGGGLMGDGGGGSGGSGGGDGDGFGDGGPAEAVAQLCARCLQAVVLIRGGGCGIPSARSMAGGGGGGGGSAGSAGAFSDVDDIGADLLQALSLAGHKPVAAPMMSDTGVGGVGGGAGAGAAGGGDSDDGAWPRDRELLELSVISFFSRFIRLYGEQISASQAGPVVGGGAGVRAGSRAGSGYAHMAGFGAGAGAGAGSGVLPPSPLVMPQPPGRDSPVIRTVLDHLVKVMGVGAPHELLDIVLAKLLDNMRGGIGEAASRVLTASLRVFHELAAGVTIVSQRDAFRPVVAPRGSDLLRTVTVRSILRRPLSESFPALTKTENLRLRSMLYATLGRLVFLNARALSRAAPALSDAATAAAAAAVAPGTAGGVGGGVGAAGGASVPPSLPSKPPSPPLGLHRSDTESEDAAEAYDTRIWDWDSSGESWFHHFVAPLEADASRLHTAMSAAEASGAPDSIASDAGACKAVVCWLRDVRGVVSAAATVYEFRLAFEWLRFRHLGLLPKLATHFRRKPEVLVPLLHLLDELGHNRSRRISFPARDAAGIILFKALSETLTAVVQHIVLAVQGPHAATVLRDEAVLKTVRLAFSATQRCLDGDYVNFGIMALYKDEALTNLWTASLQLLLSVPAADILARPKLTASAYKCLYSLTSLDLGLRVLRLTPPVLGQYLGLLREGIRGQSSSGRCAAALDVVLTRVHDAVSALAKAKPEAVAGDPRMAQHAEVQAAFKAHLAAHSQLWQDVILTLLQAVLHDPMSRLWAISRPLLGALLLFGDLVKRMMPQVMAVAALAADAAGQERAMALLFADPVTDLKSSSREKFTKAAFRFKRAITSHVPDVV